MFKTTKYLLLGERWRVLDLDGGQLIWHHTNMSVGLNV